MKWCLPSVFVGLSWAAGCGDSAGGDSAGADRAGLRPTFVGRAKCAGCHDLESFLWTGSHHDLAMQVPTAETVLGDFDDATFEHFGVLSTFRQRDGRFLVETDGPDGELTGYEVAYVFGVTPLQQYLIEFPGGRMQCLGAAWDSRSVEEGGQRWIHLYPDEAIPAGDELHWTGPNQNRNYMCAGCHSTHLLRNYDSQEDTFDTTWEELNVSCEACHGPGSRHVEWAEGSCSDAGEDGLMGLVLSLKDPAGGQWEIDPETGNATRSAPRASRAQSETCARCHSRRGVLRDGAVDGRPFGDSFRLSLLEEDLYFADGQIQDEVYVYGSFLQSKMHAKGVTCSDCHDPHTLQVLFPGNQLCARCHEPSKYDAPSHLHHEAGTEGANCVDCHMPLRTYMVVDPRLDHSLRVPRPDLSVKLGTPNACQNCHGDEGAEWAAERVAEWFPSGRGGTPHWAEALHAGRTGAPSAPDAGIALATLVHDLEAPGIVRAPALALLPPYLGPDTFSALRIGLRDPDPLVRAAAANVLQTLPPEDRLSTGFHLLQDPVLAVRTEAARVMAGALGSVSQNSLSPEQRAVLDRALQEYAATQWQNAERAGSNLNLGVLFLDLGQLDLAEEALTRALALDPLFVAAHVNMADLYRGQGREQEAQEVLLQGLSANPNAAAVHHALGLLYARTERLPEAVEALAQAAGLDPDNARYAYVHGVSLHTLGDRSGGLEALARALLRHPHDGELLAALATMHRDEGDLEQALQYALRLAELTPGDPQVEALLLELRNRVREDR